VEVCGNFRKQNFHSLPQHALEILKTEDFHKCLNPPDSQLAQNSDATAAFFLGKEEERRKN